MSMLPLISLRTFIQATRDSGYKTTSSALAELVDNSLEAEATSVSIEIEDSYEGGKTISVLDNGEGMSRKTLQFALQFGGSSRFNSRKGSGRYGMGLPNGSLSQARRVDVYSWQNPMQIWASYLDVDEVASGAMEGLGEPVRFTPEVVDLPQSPSGTKVVLSKCDRLDFRRRSALTRRLGADLGRWFRTALFAGKEISINGIAVKPWDPMFLRGAGKVSAEPYGPPMGYDLELANGERTTVTVSFSLLPIREWHSLSNEEKNARGISKGAGVSILRNGREIDFGWYFMGTKRKENYDDWWRCEIRFDADADELFGVTHTKQRISPTEALNGVLGEDLERIARELNALVRKVYLSIKDEDAVPSSVTAAQKKDVLLPPLSSTPGLNSRSLLDTALARLQYSIEVESQDGVAFYIPALQKKKLRLVLNRDHDFFRKMYAPLEEEAQVSPKVMLQHLQLLLLSAARAELTLRPRDARRHMEVMRDGWGNALTAFLR